MKQIVIMLSLLAVTASAADDFDSIRARLKEREKKIAQRLEHMGSTGNANRNPSGTPNEENDNTSLFRIHNSLSANIIPVGSLFFGQLHTRLVVGGEGAPVIVSLSEDNKFGQISGLRILGLARQSSTEDRIVIDFERLILRSGKSISIEALGLDELGALGFQAQAFSSKAMMVAGAMASSFISGYAASQQTQSTSAFGFSEIKPTGRNALLQGVAQTAADQAKNFIDKETKEKPVLVLEEGTEVVVFLNKEMHL